MQGDGSTSLLGWHWIFDENASFNAMPEKNTFWQLSTLQLKNAIRAIQNGSSKLRKKSQPKRSTEIENQVTQDFKFRGQRHFDVSPGGNSVPSEESESQVNPFIDHRSDKSHAN